MSIQRRLEHILNELGSSDEVINIAESGILYPDYKETLLQVSVILKAVDGELLEAGLDREVQRIANYPASEVTALREAAVRATRLIDALAIWSKHDDK